VKKRSSNPVFAALQDFGRVLFPQMTIKTDRLVRKLVWTNVAFLAIVSLTAEKGLVALAAIQAGNVVGAAVGLLFAVPRRVAATSDSGTPGTQQVGYLANTSLEEVSDWITKTIIGAGLVSWQYVLATLDRSGRTLGWALVGNDPDLAIASGVAVILASSTFGALIGYLWFARHWPSELAIGDTDARGIFQRVGLSQERKDVAPDTPSLPPAGDGGGAAADDGAGAGDETGGEEAGTETKGQGHEKTELWNPPIISDAARLRAAAEQRYALMRTKPDVPHDWVKNLFGGQSSLSRDGKTRALTASVRQLDSDWFEVTIELVASPPPETEAIFFLHNTFKNPTPTAGFGIGGVARLTVTAYGAFTVGALCDDGSTALELDLAELPGVPAAFRNR
jgi:hypothetical protein